MDASLAIGSNSAAARSDFYRRLAGESLAPLWESLAMLVTPTPQPKAGSTPVAGAPVASAPALVDFVITIELSVTTP